MTLVHGQAPHIAGRPDHDARLVLVTCERCGLEQPGGLGRQGSRKPLGCIRCGHKVETYSVRGELPRNSGEVAGVHGLTTLNTAGEIGSA